MATETFPIGKKAIVGTLIQLFRARNEFAVVEILEAASVSIIQAGYDNWNGGTDIYSLHLDIPVKLFAIYETKLSSIEATISKKLETVIRVPEGFWLKTVSIMPILEESMKKIPLPRSSEEDLDRIWEKRNFFRLFISHLSADKVAVSKLKYELGIYGISGFVAHEDIKPTEEWIIEIERALNSAEALLALLTPDFHQSKWTDQEVGIAIGKGLLVIPVRAGVDPYGFVGKHQAITGDLGSVKALCADVIQTLLRNQFTGPRMREALVCALEQSTGFADSISLSKLIVSVDGFSALQLNRMTEATMNNNQVSGAFGVKIKIDQFVSKVSSSKK